MPTPTRDELLENIRVNTEEANRLSAKIDGAPRSDTSAKTVRRWIQMRRNDAERARLLLEAIYGETA